MTAIDRKQALVAVDLGAESCRVSLLRFHNGSPVIRLVHRTANGPVETGGQLHWDFDAIYASVLTGLHKCAELAPEGIAAIGVDGWAVDNVRLDGNGNAIGQPFCYRDERTVTAVEKLQHTISADRLYELTGAQDIRINTLYQLYSDTLHGVPGDAMWLNLPEYLTYLLGGRKVSEYTNATHTQMLGVDNREWVLEILAAAGLSAAAMPEMVRPGTVVGTLAGELAEFPAFHGTKLIVPACHDTASAIAGIPVTGADDWAYISSGTWSLVGTVVQKGSTGPEARAENLTNQGGTGGINLQKNVNGMWLIRQCIEQWKLDGKDWDIAELVEASSGCEEPQHLLDVDDPSLMLPGDMPARINYHLQSHGHLPLSEGPENAPRYACLIFHSLAARYKQVIDHLASISGKELRRLFIVGGGSRNAFLNELVGKATGLAVVPSSPESSTLGNFAVQLASLEENPGTQGVSSAAVGRWATVLNEPGVLQH
ncbi:MAG TPA: FGGY family carbohydrate kinase [Granulicella sp.]